MISYENRISKSIFRHIIMDPKKLRKEYMQSMPQLNAAMEHVKSQLSDLPPSDFKMETNMKPYLSMKRKMLDTNVKHPLELSDLVRGRIFFSKQYVFKEVLELLKKLLGDKISKVEKKNTSEHGLEYHGVMHVDLEIDGIKFELQVLPQEFEPYKDFLHKIYEKLRSPKNNMSEKEQKLLKTVHNRIYKKLDRQTRNNDGD
jgi:hypothetical protein